MTTPVAPSAVRWITRTLEEAGHETWAVGGAVRDSMLGGPTGDWDFATHARPEEVRRIFRRTVPIGVEHGTVGVLARDGRMYEVTTFRRDVETDGRHAVVEFAETLEEDLSRRDFTINAIAWHPVRNEVRDPFDGAGDLDRSVLRTVGEPEQRFREDYLRILRALRFAGHFALDIDPPTWGSLCGLVEHLPKLSAERIRDELLKVLDADRDPTRSLELYAESGALGVLFPELDALREGVGVDEPSRSGVSRWTIAVGAAAHIPPGRAYARLAALLKDRSPEAAVALLMRLRISNNRVDEVARLAAAEPMPASDGEDAQLRGWLSRHAKSCVATIARLELARAKAAADLGLGDAVEQVVASWRNVKRVRAANPPLQVSDLELDGRALIGLGLKPGPHFGDILDELLEWVLEDPARNRRATLEERALRIAEQPDG